MKFIALFIIFLSVVHANDISYSFHVSNHTPYKNEAILLDVNITQEDYSQVMLFNFTLQESKAYTFHQIDFKENDEYHHLKHQYKYLIYPKQEGNCSLSFKMLKSLTDDDKVAYAISGDRDNVKKLVKKDINIQLEPLLLKVKSLPKGTDLVGDFKLEYSLDKSTTDAYEPVHLKVLLKGKGTVPPLSLIEEDVQYHLFTQAPKIESFYSKQGTHNTIKWDYAISAKEDFSLSKVVLKAFNPITEKSYTLVLPQQTIHVNQVAVETLVDKEDTPASAQGIDWSWLGWLFSYTMVFLAGFLIPRDFFKRKSVTQKSDEELFRSRIVAAKTHKELLKLLLGKNEVQYKEAILSLENVVYNKKKISLDKIKKML